jgi:peptide/nickel transport system ATP-binding protein
MKVLSNGVDAVVSTQGTLPLMELRELTKRFEKRLDVAEKIVRLLNGGPPPQSVHAVDKVDLQIFEGEVVGLVGESGCGKSTLGRMVVGLETPTAGALYWKGTQRSSDGKNVVSRAALDIQMIFQDPYASLNPRLRVEQLVGEAPLLHGITDRSGHAEYVADLLRRVGVDPGSANRFPHQFSGGQRARIGIARALAVKPKFIVCDESVAALDVSVQAQVLNLFMQLREDFALTYLFISHDLGVVKHISDRVVVMYLGRVVESAATDELFARPLHPYTQALLSEAPTLRVQKRAFPAVSGEIPSPLAPPSGCHFHPRCMHAMPVCSVAPPPLTERGSGHLVACHLVAN